MEGQWSKDKPIEQSHKYCLGVHSLLLSNFYFEMVIGKLTKVAEVTDHRLSTLKYAGCPLRLDIKNPSGQDSH